MSDDSRAPKALDSIYGRCVDPVTTAKKREYGRWRERFNSERRKRIEKCWDCSQIGQCNPEHCAREKGRDNGVQHG